MPFKTASIFVRFSPFHASIFLLASLREKCPYSEFLWSVFSRIWTEYGKILHSTHVLYHVTYAFQSGFTHHSYLNVKELLARNRRNILILSGYNGTPIAVSKYSVQSECGNIQTRETPNNNWEESWSSELLALKNNVFMKMLWFETFRQLLQKEATVLLTSLRLRLSDSTIKIFSCFVLF